MDSKPTERMMTTEPILLTYADAPAREGVVLETTADGLRITIPQSRRSNSEFFVWFTLRIGAPAILILLANMVIGPPSVAWAAHYVKGHPFEFIIIGSAVMALAWAIVKLGPAAKPIIIELNSMSLVMINALSGAGGKPIVVHPRGEVARVIYEQRWKCLAIHFRTMEAMVFRPSRDPVVVKWIASQLHEALTLK